MKTKLCTKCKTEKNINEFYKHAVGSLYSFCKMCKNADRPKYKKETPIYDDEKRNYFYQKKYGISLDDYNKLFDKQESCCKICGRHQSEFNKALHVDHRHSDGVVRGLLCFECNVLVGMIENNINLLGTVFDYLETVNVSVSQLVGL